MSGQIPIQAPAFDVAPQGASEAVAQQQAAISGYSHLLESIRVIQVERGYRASMELIEARYEIGEVIWQSGLYQPYAYGQKLVPQLAQDLNISSRNLHYSLAFYKKAQEKGGLELFMAEIPKHQTNWGSVRRLLGSVDELPEPEPKKEENPNQTISNRQLRKAVVFCRGRIGKVWTERDAWEMESMLRKTTPKPGAGRPEWKGGSNNQQVATGQVEEAVVVATETESPNPLMEDWGGDR